MTIEERLERVEKLALATASLAACRITKDAKAQTIALCWIEDITTEMVEERANDG